MSQWSGRADPSSAKVRGVGEADEGRVRVTVTDERLETVRVEPRLLRSSPRNLSELLIEAVNAALEDFRARSADAVPAIDLDEVADDMRKANEQFQYDARRRMSEAAEIIAGLRRDGVRIEDLPTVDFGDLVDELDDVMRTVRDAQNLDDEELAGIGEIRRGEVRAVCVPTARLDSLTLDSRALRGTLELERDVVTVVNAALEDLAAEIQERQARADIDADALHKRLGQVRERNLARLGSYFQSMSDVINGIEPER
jgi:DNA-binding protein YbaB